MPKIKITGLPMYKGGGTPPNCDEGYMPSTDGLTCVIDPSKWDGTGCLIGKQRWSDADQMCIPIDGYDPTAYDNKNKPVGTGTNAAGETVGGVASSGKTGPGTGVNPYANMNQDCPEGFVRNALGICIPKKRAVESIVEAGAAAGNFFGALAQERENRRVENEFLQRQRNRAFTDVMTDPGIPFRMGKVETASGVEFPSMMTPPNEGMFSNAGYGYRYGQFGGDVKLNPRDKKVKIKVLETPDGLNEMKYGGQSSYGLDLGWKIGYTDMAKTKADHHGDTMSENDDPEKVLEAEGEETIYKPGRTVGDSELYTIKGKRHSQGGVKLSKDQVKSGSDLSSFIFSDTASLKIKDPKVLEFFGFKYKKGGYTPAHISKKFELNKYKAILEDPVKQSDALAIRTAELMSAKNEKMLKFLAAVQENMKGKEVPDFAMDSVAEYGGALLKYDKGGKTDKDPELGEWSNDYETLKTLLLDDINAGLRKAMFEEFLKDYPNSPLKNDKDGQQKFINNFLEAQRQIFAIRAKYADKPEMLKGKDWDTTKNKSANKRYYAEAKSLGFTPLSFDEIRRFQAGYRALARASQRDPKFFETFGQYFKLTPIGVADEPTFLGKNDISDDDAILGNTTLGQIAQLRKPYTPTKVVVDITTTLPPAPKDIIPKYICLDDGTIQEVKSGTGYDSPAEAAKHCKQKLVKKPYDFLLPDKLNMLVKSMHYPEVIMPMVGQLDSIPGQLSLEDWRAKAAQRFSTQYAAPAAQLASYTGPQGLTANLSMLAGQTAQQMAGEDIAPTNARNIERVNQFSQAERARQDTVNQFNLAQRLEGDQKRAIARQNLVKEKRMWLKENVDSFAQAWLNRMYLGDINDSNTNFYKDPTTGRNIFYNTNTLGIAGLSSGNSSDPSAAGTNFNQLYKMFYDGMTNLPDDKRAEAAYELAMEAMGTQTRTKKDKTTGESITTRGINFGG